MINITTKGRILSITHEQDIDGLFCGAILKNAFPGFRYTYIRIRTASNFRLFYMRLNINSSFAPEYGPFYLFAAIGRLMS